MATHMMLSVAQAQQELLSLVHAKAVETLPLSQALGRICAQTLYAKRASPPFASAAMDGYAVRWADCTMLPTQLKIVGFSQAGQRYQGAINPGEAVRIYTGAPIPEGADSVIAQEDTKATGTVVTVLNAPNTAKDWAGAHIRPVGLDFAPDQCLVAPGVKLTGPHLGLLAVGLHTHVPVYCQPSLALFCLGDELVAPGSPLGPDQIVSSNGLVLSGSLGTTNARITGADTIIPDDPEAIRHALKASPADFLVTVGGASVGARDYVHDCLKDLGAHIAFWKIALRPGRPLMVARLGKQMVFGLPGNPVSAFVCAELFLKPALRYAQGMANPLPIERYARWASPQRANGGRADYMRARAFWHQDHYKVQALAPQDSAMLSILSQANALAIRPPNAPEAQKDDWTTIIPLDADTE